VNRRPVIVRAVIAAAAVGVVAGGITAAVVANSAHDPSPKAAKSHVPIAAPVTAHATDVRRYEPWTADGKPLASLTIVRASGDASCWEGSIVSARSDAYRCSTAASYEGGNLFDPCIASPVDAHQLLCPAEPLSANRVLAVTSAHPGPSNPPTGNTAASPWEIGLSGAVSCRKVSGASAVVHGYRMTYVCSNGLSLWGDPQRAAELWTIRGSRSAHPARFDMLTVTHAWY
jgi:hypothetical protein